MYPSMEKYRELSGKYRRVVIYREIAGDLVTPISLIRNFSDRECLFLLESADLDKSFSRFTFFGFNPSRIISYRGGRVLIKDSSGTSVVDANPVDVLMELLEDESSNREPEFGNFAGGYVGFMGYDMANHMGILRSRVREDEENTTMLFMETDEFYVFDNFMGKTYAAVSMVCAGDPEEEYARAERRTFEMAFEITDVNEANPASSGISEKFQDFEKEHYMEAVGRLKELITSGECIQVVLSNKYEIRGAVNPMNLYRLMRNINPSPYMFYIKNGSEVLCGTSPEVHLRIEGRKATLKPIAGTYRLDGTDPELIKKNLLSDEKERAEHLMLLDLARNDLYTGCRSDSVRVISSFEPEVYSHLVHIVSEVSGELRDGVMPLKLFCNTFPAGTVSGAPKVRAMELIDEHEVSPRGFYSGCAGYFSYSGDVDTCIIIRSAMVKKDSVVFRAGAGIVYDSVPEKEFLEVENKLGAAFDSLRKMSVLEEKNVFAN
ncbi:MAG: anthranilate synthase component I family protein [Spirochaetes bacterium]|jgi:anthranilate synthase component 1|nr:anthranilate synthase component I family protein [Spirochaetota bacterium]